MAGPLDGVRVLDLTSMVAGPVATMILADQGADVIKIEPPGGDLMRHLSLRRNGMSAFFLSCNRNKRSLSVDLKSHDGIEIMHKLIPTADVLVHNFRPGTAERIGLSEVTVRALRKDLVYVSISGYGESGPYSAQRAYDPVIQAMSGLADIQADKETGRPRMVRTIVADNVTALTAAQAITAALFARGRSGQGQHVRLAMLDAMIAFLWPEAMPGLTLVGDERDPSMGEEGPDLVFATQDRYITAAALSDDEWAGMCRALKREDLLDDPRFKTSRARAYNSAERRALVASELEQWRADEILPRLMANDVPSAPVLRRYELLNDQQVSANHLLQEYESPAYGRVRQPRPAASFERTASSIRTLAPYLGADNAAILSGLGYTTHAISRLTRDHVIHEQPAPAASDSAD
ncbi:MAG TPA: CoA transferase [Candidatus Binataceae bacterium]|nr:CoA transferase [Candidatus Binataceae bacterium]